VLRNALQRELRSVEPGGQFKVSALCAAIRAVSLETSPIVISFWTEEGLKWNWVHGHGSPLVSAR